MKESLKLNVSQLSRRQASLALVRVSCGLYHICLCIEHLAVEQLGLYSAVVHGESKS